jgi:glucose-6-phosphate 1-dehydrogenase
MTKKNLIKNKRITKGIKISCSTKRKLYLSCRQHPKEEIKRHYQLYSKILANVIREAKKNLKSNNKSKTTWNIIKEISGHKHQKIDVQDIKIEHKHVTDIIYIFQQI